MSLPRKMIYLYTSEVASTVAPVGDVRSSVPNERTAQWSYNNYTHQSSYCPRSRTGLRKGRVGHAAMPHTSDASIAC